MNKNKQILIVIALFVGVVGFAQDKQSKTSLEFSWINLSEKIKNKELFFIAKESKKKKIQYNKIFDKNDSLVSYQKKVIKYRESAEPLTNTKLKEKQLKGNIKVNLAVKGDSIFINPWLFIGKDSEAKNKFFNDNYVYLKMESRKNYSFKHRSWSLRAVTLPIKWYMSSELGNVETDLNAMLSLGRNFGKEKFVKFPHEKETRHYKTLWSLNGMLGLSKLDIDESNRVDGSSVKGNVAAFTTGLGVGVHWGKFSTLITTGFDFPLSNRKDWQFSNTPFLAIGFGFDFLTL